MDAKPELPSKLSKLDIELQNPYHYTLPDTLLLTQWANAAFHQKDKASVTLRFVDKAEGLALNTDYRDKHYATNILSFTFDAPVLPQGVTLDFPCHLGDLVICHPVIKKEANEQQKTFEQHCAHLIIHGMLHLQGYDHIEEQQAQKMETLEINILKQLNYPNPYSI